MKVLRWFMPVMMLFLGCAKESSPSAATQAAAMATPRMAHGGNGVDNGGDHLALSFTTFGYEVLAGLKKLSPDEAILRYEELAKLEAAIKGTRVAPIKGPLFDNAELKVDARFVQRDGKPVIELDQDVWNRLINDSANVQRLVFHEYLRAMPLNDDNYRISAKIEEGTMRKILDGYLVISPDGVGGQTAFEQLGDYFERASVPKIASLGSGASWRGYCMWRDALNRAGEAGSLSITEVDRGPVLSKDYRIKRDEDGSIGTDILTGNGMLYSLMKVTPNSLHWSEAELGGGEVFMRSSGDFVFMEQVVSSGPDIRCYYWKQ